MKFIPLGAYPTTTAEIERAKERIVAANQEALVSSFGKAVLEYIGTLYIPIRADVEAGYFEVRQREIDPDVIWSIRNEKVREFMRKTELEIGALFNE